MKAWTRRRDERGMLLSEGRFQIGPWVLGICSSNTAPGTAGITFPGLAGVFYIDPWSGKISHALEQLSPCATTTEPVP